MKSPHPPAAGTSKTDHLMQQKTWVSIKWLSLGISLGSIIVAIVLMYISGPEQISQKTETAPKTSNTQVESPVIIERKDGNIVWTLRAKDANQQLDGNMRLSQPTLVLYTENQQEINIVSQQAWFNPLTRNLRFEDQVLVHYKAWSIASELLLYVSSSDELHMPETFKLWGKSIKAHGKNMRLHRNNEQVTVSDGIWIEDSNPHWQGVTP